MRAAFLAAGRGAALPLLLASALSGQARADKPCPPETVVASRREARARFGRLATWIAVGEVERRVEKHVPHPNCALDDRSKCAQWDRSELTVKVERYEKGKGPAELVLVAERCAPDPPGSAGGRYRFYGRGSSRAYLYFEPAAAAAGK
jgi:hypothetical protein